MTNFGYNNNVPNGPDDPADDQPEMLTNTQSISGLINVDHVNFNTDNGGFHKQSTYLQESPPGLNGGPANLTGVLFGGVNSNDTWPHWQNTTSGSIGVLLANGVPLLANNGYTFVTGGTILQWGRNTAVTSGSFSSGSASGTVTFSSANISFTNNCFLVLTIPFYTSTAPNGAGSVDVDNASLSRTAFNWKFNSNSGSYTGFYWFAIGN